MKIGERRLAAAKACRELADDLRAGVVDVAGVKAAQLVETVKLEDVVRVIAPDAQLQLVEMRGVDRLPELVADLRRVILPLKDLDEFPAERLGPEHVPHHVPRVLAADADPVDIAVAALVDAPLGRGPVGIERGIIGVVHAALEGIAREVVVRRADVGVAEQVARGINARVVVAAGVFGVVDDGDAELLPQVCKALLHVPAHEHDAVDAGVPDLADLPLDEHLAAHGQQALVRLIRQRREAAGGAGGHNDCVVYFIQGLPSVQSALVSTVSLATCVQALLFQMSPLTVYQSPAMNCVPQLTLTS